MKDDEGSLSEDQIDVKFLIAFGLLHCVGSARSKAEVLYNLLQEGGLEMHKWISATDKDIIPIFEKMCLLVTCHLFVLAEELTDMHNSYEDHMEELAEAHEDVREDHFLEEVYGKMSRLENELWLEGVSEKSKWVFDAPLLRLKVFEVAGCKFDE